MNTIELIVLSCLLLGLAVLGLLGFLRGRRSTEHFTDPAPADGAPAGVSIQVPECPTGYKFFNDKAGNSMCCKGSVDPYKHTCSGKGAEDICAFLDTIADPRNLSRNLPLCAAVFDTQYQQNSANNCPAGLPYYADNRAGKTMCCKNRAEFNGRQCSNSDMADKKNYCIVTGTLGEGEQTCDNALLFESAAAGCPTGLSMTPILLGTREVTAYGNAAKDLKVPACASMTDTCIPAGVITHLKTKGIYTGKDPETWSKSCSVWTKINIDRDTTITPVTAYP